MRSSRNRPLTAAALALAMLSPACLTFGKPVPESTEKIQFGDSEETLKPPTAKKGGKKGGGRGARPTAGIRAIIKDQDGIPRSGVPLTYSGPQSGRVVSGAGGVAFAKVKPGVYALEVPAGCGAQVEVFRGTKLEPVGVARAQTTEVPLKVTMRRRYGPGSPIEWSPEPPWQRGKTVTFSFLFYDRCENREPGPLEFRYLRYRPSAHLKMIRPAYRSNRESKVVITFQCVRAGEAELWLEDRESPKDATDLLALRPPFDPNTEWCG